MGIVTYSGPSNERFYPSDSDPFTGVSGVSYTLSDPTCSALLAQYPAWFSAGDSHTLTLLPPQYPIANAVGSFAGDYDSTKTYVKGHVVSGPYLCVASSVQGVDPTTDSGVNWKKMGNGGPPSPSWLLIAWTEASAFQISSATRDGNGAITTASIVWPDGATGTFTTDAASTVFPGAIDAYHVTYVYNPGGGNVTKTITQTAVTRDPSTGAVTAQPAITVA